MREQNLEDIFATARAQPPSDSEPLMARVLADAVRHLPQPDAPPRQQAIRRKTGFWAVITATVGGQGVLAGLGTAALVGLMFGYAQPASYSMLTASILAEIPLDEVELLPGIEAILIEG